MVYRYLNICQYFYVTIYYREMERKNLECVNQSQLVDMAMKMSEKLDGKG